MWEVVEDALLDTGKMLPFLFGAYLLIEFIERKTSRKMQRRLSRLGPLGPIGGALLGVVPQCGFSVTAAGLFSEGIITIGTVIAVFLSTSDEALPILVSHPESFSYLWKLILLKVGIAIVAGIGVDLAVFLFRRSRQGDGGRDAPLSDEDDRSEADPPETIACEDGCDHQHGESCGHDHHGHKDCGCGSGGNIFVSSVCRTIKTGLFILVVNLALGTAIYFIGEETIGSVMLHDTVFQPFLAALVGMIPNCASSVILTELFLEGALSFGSCLAGLCIGAGIGLAVLFRRKRNWKVNLFIVGFLYAVSVSAGLLTDLFI